MKKITLVSIVKNVATAPKANKVTFKPPLSPVPALGEQILCNANACTQKVLLNHRMLNNRIKELENEICGLRNQVGVLTIANNKLK